MNNTLTYKQQNTIFDLLQNNPGDVYYKVKFEGKRTGNTYIHYLTIKGCNALDEMKQVVEWCEENADLKMRTYEGCKRIDVSEFVRATYCDI